MGTESGAEQNGGGMMETVFTIQVRKFPVTIKDVRTGNTTEDVIVLDKAQLQAVAEIGMDSYELINRTYNRQGFKVLDIEVPEKRTISIDLAELYRLHSREAGA